MLHVISRPHRENLCAFTEEAQKLFVLLKVIPAAHLAQVRPPLALALVMDTSGSMGEPGERGATKSKLSQAQSAVEAILGDARLVGEDLVSLIGFSNTARVLHPLAPLGDCVEARHALKRLGRSGGGTCMAQGLAAARDQLGRILDGGAVQRVIVLTDGQTSDPVECEALARQLAAHNAPLVTIGVGDDYNEELLRDLAQTGRGRPYHLAEIERLNEVFRAEVQASMREVVTDLRAQIETVRGVQLDSVTRVYPDLAEMEIAPAGEIALGNVQSGDFTVFVLELTVAGVARNAGRVRLCQMQLSGNLPTSGMEAESSRHDVVVSFTGEAEAVGRVDEEVLSYVQQRNADRLVQKALRQSRHDPAGARTLLKNAVDMTQRLGNVSVTQMLQNSLDELTTQGHLSSGTRKTIALETRTRTVLAHSADRLGDLPDEDVIRRLTGA